MTQQLVIRRKSTAEFNILEQGIPCGHSALCEKCNGVSLDDQGIYWFSEEIDDAVSDNVRADITRMFLDRHRAVRPGLSKDITVMLETPGGYVGAGLAIFGTLTRLQKQYPDVGLTMLVDGNTASMGVAVFQVAGTRQMSPTASLLIHGVKGFSFGETKADELFNEAENLQKSIDKICAIYAIRNTKGNNDPEWWKSQIKKNGEWMIDAVEALKLGLVDEIV